MVDMFNAPCTTHKYDDRPTSRLVCYLHEQTGIDYRDMAKWIGVKYGTFRNKMSHGNFSLDNVYRLCILCGYRVELRDLSRF